jgi:hypothetical protein
MDRMQMNDGLQGQRISHQEKWFRTEEGCEPFHVVRFRPFDIFSVKSFA